jgi:isopentenyldiphosphate isomerase
VCLLQVKGAVPMNEDMIDIYDSDMNVLGMVSCRQAHQEGLWHKVAHCWIVTEDGDVWLREAVASHDKSPLDVSVVGHVMVGETPKQTAVRKLEEDFGLHVKEPALVKMFTAQTLDDTDGHNREFNPIYVLQTQLKPEDIDADVAEVAAVYVADIQSLTDLFLGDVDKIQIKGLSWSETECRREQRMVSKADFYPYGDKFYQKVFASIQRFIDNQ